MRYEKTIPTESAEQQLLFRWLNFQSGKFPELNLAFHIPNGGSRNKLEAANLKRQGVKSGVPDICLPVPRGRYHGLYIELKRQKGGTTNKNQENWLFKLSLQGYRVEVCKGWEAAAAVIEIYIKEGK